MKNQQRMFLIVLTILLVLAYPLITKAQKPPGYGIKAGMNLSGSSYNRYFSDSKSLKPGFQVGITGEYALTKALFLQSEIAFTTKGVVYRGADLWIGGTNPPVTHWKNTLDLLYVKAPLKLAYKFDMGSKIKLVVNAGAYAAYGVGAKDKTKNRYTGVERPADTQSYYPFKEGVLRRFDTGAIAGLGVELGSLQLAINYELGIRDIGKQMRDSSHDFEYHNQNISFTIGYALK
ncbi:porin family protein [Emticicia agri]|uniref:PorT family protein n=1 Tax=Emticicia agri TaxID=2492393 RepID=A0A4Q5LTH3_9BACT|nr:porin family protein [Emticicia agri]RYU92874.1 PorT family protein [Emticicia agri]